MTVRSIFIAILLTSGAVGVAGCDSSDDPRPVEGVVTYRQQPVAGARVAFRTADDAVFPAVADDQGRFTAQLPPGEYRATVSLPLEIPEGWREGDPLPEQTQQIPYTYSRYDTSRLTAVVEEAGPEPQTVNFELR